LIEWQSPITIPFRKDLGASDTNDYYSSGSKHAKPGVGSRLELLGTEWVKRGAIVGTAASKAKGGNRKKRG